MALDGACFAIAAVAVNSSGLVRLHASPWMKIPRLRVFSTANSLRGGGVCVYSTFQRVGVFSLASEVAKVRGPGKGNSRRTRKAVRIL